jgi:phospholipid transport system substrate-binding protein
MLQGKTEAGSKQEADLLDRATRSLQGFLDVDELGRLALKDHWDKLPAKQRQEYTTLLRKLIETNYVKGLRANLDYAVRYLGEKKRGSFLLVQTAIDSQRKGRPYTIEVDYLLRNVDGGWRTFDVITDGVGLVENYRAMFNNIIGKSGFDGLLGRMRKKLASL